MNSMTGYGRGSAESDLCRVSVELSSVNSRKQLELRFSIPRELSILEIDFRLFLQKHLSRGSVNLTFDYKLNSSALAESSVIDLESAQLVYHQLSEFCQSHKSDLQVSLSDILSFPGIINEASTLPFDEIQALAQKALEDALQSLNKMRYSEGLILKEDLQQRCEIMQELLQKIEARSDAALVEQRDRMLERLKLLDLEIDLADDRLLKELAIYAEKSDINEELVRLQSHLKQFVALLQKTAPGREMEFIGQEINRETSTLAAKSSDLQINSLALALRSEAGRLREQILNVE